MAAFKLFLVFLLFVVRSHLPCMGQGVTAIRPADGSVLTAVQVMFEFDDIYGADEYQLTIQDNSSGGTAPPALIRRTAYTAVLVTDVLSFGRRYRWQFTAFKKGKELHKSQWYFFSIASSPRANKHYFRQEAAGDAITQTDLILLDHPAIAINRRGEPVWFMPLNEDSLNKLTIRDIKLTAAGTITHLDAGGAWEKKMDGQLLWKGPDNGKVSGSEREEYHHEMIRLDDGSYIICGSIYKDNPLQQPGSAPRYNTIIRYNTDSSIRWQWDELTAMKKDSFFFPFRRNSSGGHLNGIAFNEDKSRLFMSFKNLSDVFVLNMHTGRCEASLRQAAEKNKFDFRQQHGPFYSDNKILYIYNNNIAGEDGEEEEKKNADPSAMAFRYDTTAKKFSLLWQYNIRDDKYPEGIKGKEGYVSESAVNQNFLVAAGGVNYAMEATPAGKKVWECHFYKRSKDDTAWKPYSNYRCRSISSLFPNYFTLQYAGQRKGQYLFRLYNAGTEPICCRLQFVNESTGIMDEQLSAELKPGGVQLFSIPESVWKGQNISCYVTTAGLLSETKMYSYKADLPK